MPWYLILAAGLILGALADRALIVLGDYLPARSVISAQTRPARPVISAQTRPASTATEAVTPRGRGAADILGYRDLGGRYIAPTHPVTRGARNSVIALAAWDRRNRREVA